MARIQAFPYHRPRPERMQSAEWYLRVGGAYEPLGESLPHWDPATPVDIQVRIRLDAAAVRTDCGLGAADPLRLVLTWHCPATSLRGRGAAQDLLDEAVTTVDLDLHVPAGLLADQFRLEAQLILAGPVQTRSPLTPIRPGSRLWKTERLVLLEGQAARFPMEVIDFEAHAWLPSGAAWYLDWDPNDLDQLVLGGMRLFINSRAVRVARAAATIDPGDPVAAVIKETIYFDVARTMILAVLDSEEFVSQPDRYSEESIGAAMFRLLNTLFPSDSTTGLHQQRQQASDRLECKIQASLHLFQEG